MATWPSNPSVGQTFTTPGGITYKFTSDSVWKVEVDTAAPVGNIVIPLTDNSLSAPAAGVGNNGDTAIVFNTAGDQHSVYNKVGGSWVESTLPAVEQSLKVASSSFVQASGSPGTHQGAEGDVAARVDGAPTITAYGPKTSSWPSANSGWTTLLSPQSIGTGTIVNIPGAAKGFIIGFWAGTDERMINIELEINGSWYEVYQARDVNSFVYYKANEDVLVDNNDGVARLYGTITRIRLDQRFSGTNPKASVKYHT